MPTQSPNEPKTVAAPDPSEIRRAGHVLFGAWRRLLSALARFFLRCGRLIASGVRDWARQWVRVRDYHMGAAGVWSPGGTRTRVTAAAVGLRAFAVGMAVAGWMTAGEKSAVLAGVATVLSELLWAGARFIIIALVLPRGSTDRSRLSVVYFAGLVPYLFGVTGALRLVTLAASAYLTRRGLISAGIGRRDADLAIGWSFGGQVGVVAAGWLFRALLAVVVGL